MGGFSWRLSSSRQDQACKTNWLEMRTQLGERQVNPSTKAAEEHNMLLWCFSLLLLVAGVTFHSFQDLHHNADSIYYFDRDNGGTCGWVPTKDFLLSSVFPVTSNGTICICPWQRPTPKNKTDTHWLRVSHNLVGNENTDIRGIGSAGPGDIARPCLLIFNIEFVCLFFF